MLLIVVKNLDSFWLSLLKFAFQVTFLIKEIFMDTFASCERLKLRRCTCFLFFEFFKSDLFANILRKNSHCFWYHLLFQYCCLFFLHCKVFLHSLFFSMLDNPTINVPLWSIHLLYITKFTESAKASNSVCFFCYLEFSPWFYVFVCSELLSLFYHCKFDFHTNSPLIMENVVERSSKMNEVTNRVDISINM